MAYVKLFFVCSSVELEDREYQATLHVRDSVQLVENAMLEKEQVSKQKLNCFL